MEFEYKDKTYEVLLGSDVVRDGVFLELSEKLDDLHAEAVMEIFFSDVNGDFICNVWKPIEIPFEKMELFIRAARERLPDIRHLEDNIKKKE